LFKKKNLTEDCSVSKNWELEGKTEMIYRNKLNFSLLEEV